MKRLVYGIVSDSNLPARTLRHGLGGCPVALLVDRGLAAAYSEVPESCSAPSIAQLQGYARVVETLHQVCTILPMRYGCLLETEDQILELLRARRANSLAALKEVEGCMELGLRVLAGDMDAPNSACDRTVAPDAIDLSRIPAGTGYLSKRRALYVVKDSQREQTVRAGDRFRRIFAGLYVKCEAEPLFTASGVLLSLHFLVRRRDEDRFRAAFRQLQKDGSHKVLLTGPWPPYHFAACSTANGLP